MAKKKETPLTLEIFREILIPEIRLMIDERLEEKITPYKNDIANMKDEILGEIKGLREEIAIALHQYRRTNRRIDRIDGHLGINTSDID